MDRDLVSGLLVEGVEGLVEGFDVVVESGPGNSGDGDDADGVFVAEFQCGIGVEGLPPGGEGHGAEFDLPQLAELLPDDLIGGAHDQVWFVVGFSGGLSSVSPAEPGGDASQHTGFG